MAQDFYLGNITKDDFKFRVKDFVKRVALSDGELKDKEVSFCSVSESALPKTWSKPTEIKFFKFLFPISVGIIGLQVTHKGFIPYLNFN